MSEAGAPLILTAELPPGLHRRFTALRSEHFPPERNHLEAHVTLFHALPPMCEGELRRLLGRLTAAMAPVGGRIEGIMPMGSGTAIRLASHDLLMVRGDVAEHFHGMLTAQDSHNPRLHVTVQNKVTPAQAKALQASLAPIILPERFKFPGLALHRYRGGPWEFVARWPFRGK
ncbi:2'-5' RNA ligase family protein [Qipengyuania marisflavi]|uniref:2'-5' RNA ligase family protein n=1 Tax=Qipengyuania marisflavi TaxID=2486356 RepID=UPI001FE9C283|nr:2'-5' RNA ligase family protein [Qipengyuania marisflavi]